MRGVILRSLGAWRSKRGILGVIAIGAVSSVGWIALLVAMQGMASKTWTNVKPIGEWVADVPTGTSSPRMHEVRSSFGMSDERQVSAAWIRDDTGKLLRIEDVSVRRTMLGWPIPALRMVTIDQSQTHSPRGDSSITRFRHEGWGVRWTAGTTEMCLPGEPVWSGLLLNVAVPSLFRIGAVMAAGMVRAVFRTRNRVCVDCGYDLTGITASTCPECGGGQLSSMS